MVRKLMFMIIKKKNLKKMTATGKTREAIPFEIRKAVKSKMFSKTLF